VVHAMGALASAEEALPLVRCPVRPADEDVPFSISMEAARAAASAALGPAIVATVAGYTSPRIQQAGTQAVQLRLPSPASIGGSAASSSSAPALAVSLRSPGRLAFLAGIGLPVRVDQELLACEVVVLARPDERIESVSQLDDCTLEKLFPSGSQVDLRFLHALHPADGAEVTQQLRSATWLPRCAARLESIFGLAEAPPGAVAFGTSSPASSFNFNAHARAEEEEDQEDQAEAAEHLFREWLAEAGLYAEDFGAGEDDEGELSD